MNSIRWGILNHSWHSIPVFAGQVIFMAGKDPIEIGFYREVDSLDLTTDLCHGR